MQLQISLPNNIISNQANRIALPDNVVEILRSEKENQLIWKPSPVTDRTKIIQNSYFLYDHRSLLKKSSITVLNKFVLIYGYMARYLFWQKEKKSYRFCNSKTQT